MVEAEPTGLSGHSSGDGDSGSLGCREAGPGQEPGTLDPRKPQSTVSPPGAGESLEPGTGACRDGEGGDRRRGCCSSRQPPARGGQADLVSSANLEGGGAWRLGREAETLLRAVCGSSPEAAYPAPTPPTPLNKETHLETARPAPSLTPSP